MIGNFNISIIAAIAQNNVIGKDNQLIWYLPADLKHFKNLTTGHHIIMGRNTFESIGKPLPNRTSVIITSKKNYFQKGCIVVNTLEDALNSVEKDDEVFIIGGDSIYRQALPIADQLYITHIHKNFEGDVFFPGIDESHWQLEKEEHHPPDEKNTLSFSFKEYKKKLF